MNEFILIYKVFKEMLLTSGFYFNDSSILLSIRILKYSYLVIILLTLLRYGIRRYRNL